MFNHINYFFLTLIVIKFSNNYIVFPFKSTNPKLNIIYDNSSNFVIKFMEEMDKNKIYTKLPIGDPKKELVMYLSMLDSYFGIMKDYCTKEVTSTYDPYFSNSFVIDKEASISISDLSYAKKANDTLYFYIDKNLKEQMTINFEFLTVNKTTQTFDDYIPDAFCGKIGFLKKYYYSYPKTFSNFIDYTKKNNIIQSYQWGIFFFNEEQSYLIEKEIQNKYDGFIIVGLLDTDYSNIFKSDDITGSYLLMGKSKNIGSIFTSIYFQHLDRKIYCERELSFEMDIDHNYVICTKDYYENIKKYFFEQFINNTICEERTSYNIGDKYFMIICNSTIKNDLEKFPSLQLFSLDLNIQFELDYKDLFLEIDDKIYFLSIYHQLQMSSDEIWNFGKILTKKYPFMFNEDRKVLYFVHLKKYDDHSKDSDKEDKDDKTSDYPNDNPEDSNINPKPSKKDNKSFWNEKKEYIVIGLLIIVLIVGIIFGYVLGRKVWVKHRKARANELNDNYEYTRNDGDDKLIN